MLSTQRIVKTSIGAVLALVLAPATASATGAVWGYEPPTGESTELTALCGEEGPDAPYTERPNTPSQADTEACYPLPPASSPTCTGDFCPPPDLNGQRRCAGIAPRPLHEDTNGCTGSSCCESGSVADDVVDVSFYLNRPPGSELSANTCIDTSTDVDDSPGIAKAIECAASLATPTNRITVAFPAGRYVLRTPLRPHYDDLTLEGPEVYADTEPGDPDTATLVALPCNPEQYPGVIQVSRPDEDPPVNRLWIRNFQINLTDGPRGTANGGIQLNNCADCEVENVIMRYAPPTPQAPACRPKNLEGITFAGGSWGTIRNVIVDGIPKGGIYLATVPELHPDPPTTVVENCEIKNITGSVGAAGIKILTENVIVRNCEVHHNLLHGSTAIGGHGLWIATQASDGPGYTASVPACITIEDSYFHHNGGTGVMMVSNIASYRPSNITFVGVMSAYNGNYGVQIQAGTAVTFQDLWAWGNGYHGVYLQAGTTSFPSTALRVDHVTLENPVVLNNLLRLRSGSHPGILIEASDVTIDGGAFARCGTEDDPEADPETTRVAGRQLKSIRQQCWKSGLPGAQVVFYPEDNVISGVSTSGNTAPEVATCTL
ncbi:right-handed parallel beta-helix repeat-containing protein [Sorangium sp. So ce1000]|uniref:right-handed parallel beta-helix repeat-containing protein n=1 Tax=Sorangium sp. So ce1000 TaxID=3133325 RepID=UPI003F632251